MKRDYRELALTGFREIGKLEKFVEEICDYYNIANDYFGNILLATTEATTILWSINNSEQNGVIYVSFDRKPKGLIFSIRFGADDVKRIETEDILDQEIRKHKLSRDIYIIKALTDEIMISVNGRSIKLIFYITSINYEKSLKRISELNEYWHKKELFIHPK